MKPIRALNIENPGAASYRLRNTGKGSDHFGPCEVCGKHVNTTYTITEFKGFWHRGMMRQAYGFGEFGHRECLASLTGA